MDFCAIEHINDSNYSFPINKTDLRVRLRTKKNDDIKSIFCLWNIMHLMYKTRNQIEMFVKYSDELFDYYECDLISNDPRYSYLFLITSNSGEEFYYSEIGITKDYDFNFYYYNSFRYPYINELDIPRNNVKFNGDIFYQIFPERFNNGNKDIIKKYINKPWNTIDLKGSNSNHLQDVFLGGDLRGITEKIDYLSDLGINTIYLTPICKSRSNHKYDVEDYFKIDEMFGNENDLLDLVDNLHKRKMKIILDLVFNHSSNFNTMFQDVIKNGRKSKFHDFYMIDGDKPSINHVNYETFATVPSMPKLNSNNYNEIEYFVEVGKYFLNKFHIDGYRLDVANEVSHIFWQRFKYELTRINPSIILIGECWNNASSYLHSGEFDSVMNYAFLYISKEFYVENKIDAKVFAERLNNLLMRYPDGNNKMMFNLLDSHDTERFYNFVKPNKDLYLLALLTLISYTGWPMIYYGDEIFMEGSSDPYNRKGMEWDSINFGTKENILFKKILHLRDDELFRSGEIKIYSEGSLFVIERYNKDSKIKIVVNNSNHIVDYKTNGLVLLSNNYNGEKLGVFSFIVFK